MNVDLSGTSALVTGSTGGIGFAIARSLARAGAAVALNGRKQAAVDQAVTRLRSDLSAAQVRGVAGDLGTAEGCAALVAAVPSVDILVNNAGIFGPQDFFETPDDEWERLWQVNVMSGVRLSRAYLPGMAEARLGPRHLSFVRIGAQHPGRDDPLRRQQDRRPCPVAGTGQAHGRNRRDRECVLPGPTLSEGLRRCSSGRGMSGKPIEAVAAAFVMANRPSSIIQRAASVEEVANLAVYLASPFPRQRPERRSASTAG